MWLLFLFKAHIAVETLAKWWQNGGKTLASYGNLSYTSPVSRNIPYIGLDAGNTFTGIVWSASVGVSLPAFSASVGAVYTLEIEHCGCKLGKPLKMPAFIKSFFVLDMTLFPLQCQSMNFCVSGCNTACASLELISLGGVYLLFDLYVPSPDDSGNRI